MKLLSISIFLFFISNIILAQCPDQFDAIVALDGTGDYISIQDAINAAPGIGPDQHVIFIKNGIYDEKLYFDKSFITLVGENRAQTIVTTAELRRVWRESNESDWGAATVNISNNSTDLTFANLTIRNNFADVYPDFPNPNDHTFAMRGGGHRIITINCDIISTGGDTLSLWNTNGGMFYHKSCFFTGYVDFIAPRGYCYMEDCEFYGYNSTASIWHDGSGGEDHKLVIKNGNFDGKLGFALGRHHRDAQFFLIDCFFSDNMKNQKIYWEGQNDLSWSPDRKYYYNCHRPLFDWTWYKNNLQEASNSPKPYEINASWTFKNEWDPENSIAFLLPLASLPSPKNQDCFPLNGLLSWKSARCAEKHLIYLAKAENELALVATSFVPNFEVENLDENTKYQWRIDEVVGTDTIFGEIWTFKTEKISSNLPNQAYNPNPSNQGAFYENLVRLDWEFDKCTTDSFIVYFGKNIEDLEFKKIQKDNYYLATEKKNDTVYYWRIDTKNDSGITQGEVWSYTYNPSTSKIDEILYKDFKILKLSPNPTLDSFTVQYNLPQNGSVDIKLFSENGTLIRKYNLGNQIQGEHKYLIQTRNLKGLFFCKIQFKGVERMIKVIAQ